MFEYMYIQLSPTLCDPIDSSLPGSSVLGIFEAGVLKWVAISYSRGYSWPRDWTHVSCSSCIDRHILYHSATWEAQNTLVFAIKLHLICKYISPILHEFEQALEVGDGQGGLACCSPWGHSHTQLGDWTELILVVPLQSTYGTKNFLHLMFTWGYLMEKETSVVEVSI